VPELVQEDAFQLSAFQNPDPTVDKQVAATTSDGVRYTGTSPWDASRTAHMLGYNANAVYLQGHGFYRWIEVTIEGTIGVSYIQLYGYSGYTSGAAQLKVYGVDEDNPAAPTSNASFDADPLTTEAVDWDVTFTTGAWNQSPSLNSIFQELVDSYTISNEAVMVQVKNDGPLSGYNYNGAEDYSGGATYAAKLHIEYTVGGEEYSLVVDAGSYSVAGADASLPVGRVIGAGVGDYALTGAAVGLNRGLLMGAGVGNYALLGTAVDLPVDRVIGAGSGSYSLTGADIALLKDVLISAGAGSYAISGTAVSLLLGRILSAGPGSYAITGADVALLRALIMAATGGAYILTGADIAFLYGKIMVAAGGFYIIDAQPVGLTRAIRMTAEAGSYLLSGTIIYIGEGEEEGGFTFDLKFY
jgi:hypothetical protein